MGTHLEILLLLSSTPLLHSFQQKRKREREGEREKQEIERTQLRERKATAQEREQHRERRTRDWDGREVEEKIYERDGEEGIGTGEKGVSSLKTGNLFF